MSNLFNALGYYIFYKSDIFSVILTFSAYIILLTIFLLGKKSGKSANISLLLVTGTLIFLSMCYLEPKQTGDGGEYFLMTESFFNHWSPDFQAKDRQTLLAKASPSKNTCNVHYNISHWIPSDQAEPISGYYKAKNDKLYCYHFWGYSFLNLPVKFFLHIFKLNELRTFQLTNSILLIFALFHIVFLMQLTELQKTCFILLIVFSPAYWFIHWTHTEIFSYSLVTIALVYMSREEWPTSIFYAAMSSIQNQPLVFFVAFLWIKGLTSFLKEKKGNIYILSACALPAFIPFIFYYINFGVPSLLAKVAADSSYMSLFKVWEMFFDFNMGMLPYLPVTIFIFFTIIIWDIFLRRFTSLSLQIFLLLIIMMFFCTSTCNWNHGTSGPTRYVIWMLPMVFYVVVCQDVLNFIPRPRYKMIYLSALGIAIAVQTVIVLGGGGNIGKLGCAKHHYLAKAVLDNFSSLYNPSPEIFAMRTLGQEGTFETPVIYRYNGSCKKVLARRKDMKKVETLCGCIPAKYKEATFTAKHLDDNGLFYIDF